MAYWMVEAERSGITIEFVDAPNDSTEDGKLLRDLQGLFARWERQKTYKCTSEKRKARARDGWLNPSSYPMYGYRWSDVKTKQKYEIDEQAASVVRRIFESIASGMTLGTLAAQLNKEGILPPSAYHAAQGVLPASRQVATKWLRTTLRRIVLTPSYWGEHAAFRYAHSKDGRRDQTTGQTKRVYVIRMRNRKPMG